ncbi:DUF2804 family protein [Myxococcus sp. CA040A]|uniref:DUF2804 family protein n=1 Tax=Myxococcus sp. CA040A TaxID=2741738 RepID=UPI00157B5DD0|nr:DUF2804 family protein [Myxococcus sp. CA040A]NTX01978.1 DUF2804 family protein [Myxococcus sp. CA040A]
MTPESDALLPLVPSSVATPEGEPRFGTYQGDLAEVDLPSLQGRWAVSRMYPLADVRFEYRHMELMRPWKVTTVDGSVDLRFQPVYVHAEDREEALVRSKFEQPMGLFEGTVTVGGKALQLSNVPGVTKSQSTRGPHRSTL